jgi:hypothetical protein
MRTGQMLPQSGRASFHASAPVVLLASVYGVHRGGIMEVVLLGPGFAAELRGVNLIDVASSDAAYRQVREALDEHSVIFF